MERKRGYIKRGILFISTWWSKLPHTGLFAVGRYLRCFSLLVVIRWIKTWAPAPAAIFRSHPWITSADFTRESCYCSMGPPVLQSKLRWILCLNLAKPVYSLLFLVESVDRLIIPLPLEGAFSIAVAHLSSTQRHSKDGHRYCLWEPPVHGTLARPSSVYEFDATARSWND